MKTDGYNARQASERGADQCAEHEVEAENHNTNAAPNA